MTLTIWHNPKCATSRKALDAVRKKSIEPRVVDYVKTQPSAAEIKTVLKEMGIKPRKLLRKRGTPYDELGLNDPKHTDAQLVAAMAKHPIPDRTASGARTQGYAAPPSAGAVSESFRDAGETGEPGIHSQYFPYRWYRGYGFWIAAEPVIGPRFARTRWRRPE